MPPGRPRTNLRCEAHENASAGTCARCKICCVLNGKVPRRASGTTGAERNRRRKEAELAERIQNSIPLQPKDARWGRKVYIIPGRTAAPLIGFTERPRMQRGLVMEYVAKLGACVAWYSDRGIVEAAWFKLSELALIEDVEPPKLAKLLSLIETTLFLHNHSPPRKRRPT